MSIAATTEYFFNDHRRNVTHLIVEDTFALVGDSPAVCGDVARGADIEALYDLCPECENPCECDPDYRCPKHDATKEMHDFLDGIDRIPVTTIMLERAA